jgi:arginyl-tRNA synthetase
MLVKPNLKELKTLIAGALGVDVDGFSLEYCHNLEHGDLTTNHAMREAKALGVSPIDLSNDYAQKLSKSPVLAQYFKSINSVHPGFVNFSFNNETLSGLFANSLHIEKDQNNKKVIVEYSSPNIAKPFSIGHLRSTIIGDAVANLLDKVGWQVTRDNHLGDWGTQFGKLIVAIESWGDIEKIKNSDNPIKLLLDLYIKFHSEEESAPSLSDRARERFAQLEKGEETAKKIWEFCVEVSKREFDAQYSELGVKFDTEYGEQFYEDKIPKVLEILKEKGVLKVGEDGAQIVEFENEKYPPLMILKKDGSSLYATRDLAADWFRLNSPEYGPDTLIINEVGVEQSLYFKQLYELERILGWVKEGQRVHIAHGHYRLPEGKMSTRKGTVVFLDDVLKEADLKAATLSKEQAALGASDATSDHALDLPRTRQIALSAIKWSDLKRDPITDIVFDWDEILSMKGNSGPYMLYTVVRAKSVLKKSEKLPEETVGGTLLETNLVRLALRYPEVIRRSALSYSPSLLANYLYNLSAEFNSFYDQNRILGSENEPELLMVVKVVAGIIEDGLGVLGIKVPDKM